MTASFHRELARTKAAVDRASWKGRTGTSALMVLREHLHVAEPWGTLVYGLNLRTIAQRVGMSLSTVSRAHQHLKEQGWLKVATANLRYLEGRSTPWRLCLPKLVVSEQRTTKGLPPHCLIHCSDSYHSALEVAVASDLWRGRLGLGKTRYRLWATLAWRAGWTVSELAEAVGLGRQTTRRSFRVLEKYGLAQRHGKVWRQGPANIEDVAETLRLTGAARRQRERHQRERTAFRRWRGQDDEERELERLVALADPLTGEILEAQVAKAGCLETRITDDGLGAVRGPMLELSQNAATPARS